MNKLEQALVRDGEPVNIDRIETEVLENGRFRWKLWSGSELIYCAVGQVDDIAGMLSSTQVILRAMMGVHHEESSHQRPATKGPRAR